MLVSTQIVMIGVSDKEVTACTAHVHAIDGRGTFGQILDSTALMARNSLIKFMQQLQFL